MSRVVHCENMKAPHYCLKTAENYHIPFCDKADCPGRLLRDKTDVFLRNILPTKEPTP